MTDDSVSAETRAEIADAVRTALADHGYARLTTAKIAAESDMSEAGLYYHYDSKDEMIAVFLEFAADYLARDLADADATDPEAKLRAALDRLFTRHDDREGRGVNIAVMELLSHAPHNETIREPIRAMTANTIEHVAAIVEAGVKDGTFREVNPHGVAAFIVAAAHGSTGFYLALGMTDVGEALHDQVESYVDWLVVA